MNQELYTICPLVKDEEAQCEHTDCIVCNGMMFVVSGVSTKQVTRLAEERLRVQHMDRFFAQDKEAFDTFIVWLRDNPYPTV